MIELKDVTKTYNMGKVKVHALRGVSFDIKQGEFISIIGPSGSGKSTIMNILGCLDNPSEGEFHLDGKEISKYSNNDLAEIRNRKIGFVFQKFNLLPKLNAYENVELPLIYQGMKSKERHKKVIASLEKVGLSDRLHHKPTELSGGQQQRVAIARALATNPPIILADEPTGNLDSVSGKEVLETLLELNSNGITIILITHDLEVASKAKRIVTLKDGKVVEERVM